MAEDCGKDSMTLQNNGISLLEIRSLSKKIPNEVLRFILNKRSDFLSLLREKDEKQDVLPFAITALGIACSCDRDMCKEFNELMINVSSVMDFISINIQRCLVSFQNQKVLEKFQLDTLFYLTTFLKKFQALLPFSSFVSISILLPLLILTCDKCIKDHKDLYNSVSENINEIQENQKLTADDLSPLEIKGKTKIEKLHFQEPPEDFRSLSIFPTADDIDLPCLFLRPNIIKGKYKNTEHYLDVQFRLLREDYIRPLRNGIAQYLNVKRTNQSIKNCKDVNVYTDAFIYRKEFVNGDLLHVIQFRETYFSEIQWENSKRFLHGNLLCLSTDEFRSKLFATVVDRNVEKLKSGLLTIKFEELNHEVLTLKPSINFVVIETSGLFESYRHNLSVLQQLKDEFLPMKRYIIDVEQTVNMPQYLMPSTTYDLRPLLFPLDKFKYIFPYRDRKICRMFNLEREAERDTASCDWLYFTESEEEDDYTVVSTSLNDHAEHITDSYKYITVTDVSCWPTASMLNLDESQCASLKSAITKEFSIIQGPPGTGKTYIGLRAVQLLLHNINRWYHFNSQSLPILIVCYTNHALDQFLEGVMMFTEKIKRIGGQASETIEKFRVKNLRYSPRYWIPKELFERKQELREKIRSLEEIIYKINNAMENSTKHILPEHILRDYISQTQYRSLVSDARYNNLKYSIYDWLQIGAFRKKLDHNDFFSNSIFTLNEEAEANEQVTESNEKESKFQEKNNRMTKLDRDTLRNTVAMNSKRALRIKNVWVLDIHERWQLYKFWLEAFIEEKRMHSERLQEELKEAFKEKSDILMKQDLYILQDADVVGMTTTGAAKYRHIIDALNPTILIVEEAAEILESHIITTLAPKTQHVILIGDHQQLRPSPSVYLLGTKYNMDISLFERMINNGVEYCKLSVQHRMRPEIAALIAPHIYTHLENDKTVTEFENIKGVNKNVFFVTHDINESNELDSESKVNVHEAKFIIELCKYLLLQGYEPSQITVLTTYTGQLCSLKKIVSYDLKNVRFTTVDNFQGEENDIILLSFVRSNSEEEVGFLKVSNRICVALSRAKKGLYCIGNFDLLAKKSKLWKNILQTLCISNSFGRSLRLACQNHPEAFSDVAKASDFAAVPDGGCFRKCEYRLSCGHSCALSCHPYDKTHIDIKCKKPCNKTCPEGHQCPKLCFESCGPCKVMVNKVLSICGHTVEAECGKAESDIQCQHPCKTTCLVGHQCPQKCFEECEPCKIIVKKLLSRCKHTVDAECGEAESKIQCQYPCSKTCEEGHPCKKICFEPCDSCQVLVEKTLNACGHTVQAACGKSERQIVCKLPCKKVLSCLHQCVNKCYESCTEKCLTLVDLRSPVCGHLIKIECYSNKNSDELSKRCSEPCNKILPCNHTCKGTCSNCKEKCSECTEKCGKILTCGHLCANKCSLPCVRKCMQLTKVESFLCGHIIKIECFYKNCKEKLSLKCPNTCNETLPCGHICKGTCGSCHQGRLHVACRKKCERILICGHKCDSKCFMSCPPCEKPCENRCDHGKCSKKCSSPCDKCIQSCEWVCSHKKCSRRCNEICDRDPCNEPCSIIMPCNHPCAGFCGEPCPSKCLICEDVTLMKSLESEVNTRYVYLEDCDHIFKEEDISKWMNENSEGMKEIRMKTCPICKMAIRRNLRFRKTIKHCLLEIEKIKLITKPNEAKNLEIQRDLLKASDSYSTIKLLYEPFTEMLSFKSVRSIHELPNIASLINIIIEIESKTYGIHSMFVMTTFVKKIVQYMRFCREWLIDFICGNFTTVSEYQLLQMLREVHRLNLLDILLKFASQSPLASCSPDFKRCASQLVTFKTFNDYSVKCFETSFRVLRESFYKDLPKCTLIVKVVNMSGCWYRCSKEHMTCIAACSETEEMTCYECNIRIEIQSPKNELNNHPETFGAEYEENEFSDEESYASNTRTSESKWSTINWSVRNLYSRDDERQLFSIASVDIRYSIPFNRNPMTSRPNRSDVNSIYETRYRSSQEQSATANRKYFPPFKRNYTLGRFDSLSNSKDRNGKNNCNQKGNWRNKELVDNSNFVKVSESSIKSLLVTVQGESSGVRVSVLRQPIGPSEMSGIGFAKNKEILSLKDMHEN